MRIDGGALGQGADDHGSPSAFRQDARPGVSHAQRAARLIQTAHDEKDLFRKPELGGDLRQDCRERRARLYDFWKLLPPHAQLPQHGLPIVPGADVPHMGGAPEGTLAEGLSA